MKLLQKISMGVLVIIGFVGISSQYASANDGSHWKNFGAFSISEFDNEFKNVHGIRAEGGPYRIYSFPEDVQLLEISDPSAYKKYNLAHHDGEFRTNTLLYTEKIFDESAQKNRTWSVFERTNDGHSAKLTYYFEVNKNLAYSITGDNKEAVGIAALFTLNSRSNTFKLAIYDPGIQSIDGVNVCSDKFWMYTSDPKPYTIGVAKQALQALIDSDFDSGRDGNALMTKNSKLRSISIRNKIAYVDFKKLERTLQSDQSDYLQICDTPEMLKEQIKRTLTQFSTIKDVKITINGVSFDKYFEIKKNIIYDKDYDYEQEGDTTRGCGDYRIKSIEKLQIGSEGRDVGLLQKMLSNLYDIEVNGYFDAFTESAVKKFQIDRKLYPADGIVGKNTRIRLNQYFNNC